MNILMIINGAAYDQDATNNASRLAASMAKRRPALPARPWHWGKVPSEQRVIRRWQ